VVAGWCKEDRKANPDGNLVLLWADVTNMVECISAENRWWLLELPQRTQALDTDADASTLCHSSPMVAMLRSKTEMEGLHSDNDYNNAAANSVDNESYSPVTPEKKIDKDDDGKTPRQVTQRASKHAIVASPIHVKSLWGQGLRDVCVRICGCNDRVSVSLGVSMRLCSQMRQR
jgi:hypothetical protein